MGHLRVCFYWLFSPLLIGYIFLAYFVVVVQLLSRASLFATPWTAAFRVSLSFTICWSCSNSCSLSRWCHSTISSSVAHFFSCLQSFPGSGSFPVSEVFTSGGQSSGASALVLLMNIQGWFPLGFASLFSLHFKGLSRVFSSPIIQKHQLFGAQPFLLSSSHICVQFSSVTQLWTTLCDPMNRSTPGLPVHH